MPAAPRSHLLAMMAIAVLVTAAPASAALTSRWSSSFISWQPQLLPRAAGSPQLDFLNLFTDGGAHPVVRLEWIRPEDGVVRASSSSTNLTPQSVVLGSISFAASQPLGDVMVWTSGPGTTDALASYTAPGPGGPGAGFLNRTPAWRITVPTSGGGMPPMFFANVENGADLEVVIQMPSDHVRVWDRNGALLQDVDLPSSVGGDRFTSYTVYPTDTDGDGRQELIVQFPDLATGGTRVGVLGSSSPVTVPPSAPAPGPTLAPLAPNPMWARSLISWTLSASGPVSVRVYDAGGRQVRTVMEGVAPAGTYGQSWDGRDDEGRRLSPGVYMVEVAAGGQRQSRKAVLLR